MGSEYRKKQVNTQPVISEPENDSLRVLAKIIARRHIKKQLNQNEGQIDKNSINHDDDNKSSNN